MPIVATDRSVPAVRMAWSSCSRRPPHRQRCVGEHARSIPLADSYAPAPSAGFGRGQPRLGGGDHGLEARIVADWVEVRVDFGVIEKTLGGLRKEGAEQ